VDKVFAVLWGILCVVGILIPVGIGVCVLTFYTEGNWFVFVAGAGTGISFACYCGYRAALATLKSAPEPQKPFPLLHDLAKQDPRREQSP
jgi:hypothetical protein